MTLLAEEIVEEWLNRSGFFTIRGIKLGVDEIDLLALGLDGTAIQARHIEVQASINPISYLAPLPREVQKSSGRGAHNAKRRTDQELRDGMKEWVEKKYFHAGKERLRQSLYTGAWTYELVVHNLKFPQEVELLRAYGIKVHRLSDVVAATASKHNKIVGAAGSALIDLVLMRDADKHA